MQKNKKARIVFTGGHAGSTAFVLIEEIKRQKKNWDIFWIGLASSFEGESVPSLSSIYFPKYGIKTYEIIAGRIQTKLTRHTIPSFFKIPLGFIQATYLLTKIKPSLIFSFGGFSAFPVVIVGSLLRIPIIIHEQTSVVGRTNRYTSFFAKKIAVSREMSLPYFPREKTVLTGNPIPEEVIIKNPKTSLSREPVILITGGQTGSEAINNIVAEILPKLLKKFRVIHLTGMKQERKFKNIRKKLDEKAQSRYKVHGIVDLKNYDSIFSSSDLIISRSGANTVSKIVASKKPSILIPLPISYLDEQEKNAIYAQSFGIAKVLQQREMTPDKLLISIQNLIKNWKKVIISASKRQNPDIYATQKLVELIEEEVA